MIKHTQIRHAIKEAIEPHANEATVFDGRPFFVDENDFPAITVYITDAISTGENLDEDSWQAIVHIEVFLSANNPDAELDKWVEAVIYPALTSIPALSSLIENMTPNGYDYHRDEEMGLWGSVDLNYQISYSM